MVEVSLVTQYCNFGQNGNNMKQMVCVYDGIWQLQTTIESVKITVQTMFFYVVLHFYMQFGDLV